MHVQYKINYVLLGPKTQSESRANNWSNYWYTYPYIYIYININKRKYILISNCIRICGSGHLLNLKMSGFLKLDLDHI